MKRCSSRGWYATAAVFILLIGLSRTGGHAGALARYLSVALLPGIAILFLVFGERMGIGEAWIFGGALSPLILTLIAIPFVRDGGAPGSVPAAVTTLSLLILVIGLFTRGSSERRETVSPRAWLMALALTALIVVPLLVNPVLRIRSDAWFHAAVAESIGRAGLPPDDPYYAGIQLRYFWAYHVYLLTLRSAVPASLFALMAAINVVFFPIYLMTLFALSSRTGARRSGPFWSMLLAVFGINVFGSLLLAGRVAFGETRGLALLRGIVEGGSHYVLINLALHYVGSISFFLDKFLVGSAFAMTLGMFLVAVYFLVGWLVLGDRRELVFAGLFAGSAILFHTVIGLSLMLCGCGALVALSLRGMRTGEHATTRRSLIGLALLGATALLCVPYLRTILPPRGPGAGLFAVNGVFLWTVLAGGILPVVLFAVRVRREGIKGTGATFILFLIGFTLLLGTFARMPLENIDKIVYLVLLPLVVLAGGGVPLLRPLFEKVPRLGAGLGMFLIACGAATIALGLAGYIRDRGENIPVPLKNGRIAPSAADREAYRWIRENTPRQSIFINDSRLDILVMASRRQLWSPGNYAFQWGYAEEEIGWRRGIVGDVYSGTTVPPDARNRLLALGFPVYIIVRGGDLRGSLGGENISAALGAHEAYRNEDFIVGEMEPTPPDKHEEQPVR
jgi:hypothetical protein